jgi:hypothetical protein
LLTCCLLIDMHIAPSSLLRVNESCANRRVVFVLGLVRYCEFLD